MGGGEGSVGESGQEEQKNLRVAYKEEECG